MNIITKLNKQEVKLMKEYLKVVCEIKKPLKKDIQSFIEKKIAVAINNVSLTVNYNNQSISK